MSDNNNLVHYLNENFTRLHTKLNKVLDDVRSIQMRIHLPSGGGVEQFEQEIEKVEKRFITIETRLTGIEERTDRFVSRIMALETHMSEGLALLKTLSTDK